MQKLQISDADRDAQTLTTLCCLFASAVLLGAGYGIWDNVAADLHVVALVSSLACYVLAFALIVVGFVRWRYAPQAIVAGVAFAFIVYAGSYVLFKVPSYDSDAMLFNSYSAQLLLNGTDPYTQSMQPGYKIFGVPEGVTTPTLSGGEVYALSYPALSFLVYVPFLALGVTNLLWVSIAAHVVIMLMLVAAAPVRLRPIAPFVLFLDPTYFDYTVGGITDVLWLPAGMLAAIYWKRNPIAAGAALGIACAFKQTPWVIVPFAAVYWLARARQERRAAAFLLPSLALAGAFAIPNLPFILWHPKAWLAGVTTPMSAHLIVLGTGIAQLATSGLATLPPGTFTKLTLLAFAVVFTCYVLFPRRLGFLPFLAPALVFFFASRSLHNYFMYWPVVLVTYLFANRDDDTIAEPLGSRVFSKAAAVAIITVVALFPVMGRTAAPSLSVQIVGGDRNAITGRIDSLRVAVKNVAGHPLSVRFDVAEQGVEVDVQAWRPRVPQLVRPGERRAFTISAPSNEYDLETDGATATQIFVVDSDGQESYSPPVVFEGRTPKIHNADFAYWSIGRRPFPIAWEFNSEDWRGGRLKRAVVGGREAAALTAAASPSGTWKTTLLEQITEARAATLEFSVYPRSNYDEGASPTRLFGIEMRDVVGHKAFFTIDARRKTPASFSSPQGTINVVPGRLNAWNTIDVDLARLAKTERFVLSPDATMVVGAIAASRSEQSGAAAGYFGGAHAIDASRLASAAVFGRGRVLDARPALPQTEIAPARARYDVSVDDAARAPDAHFQYDGHWEHVGGTDDGRSLGTSTRSFIPGSMATLDFSGTALALYGVRGPSGGRAVIEVDGSVRHANFYSASKDAHAVVFEVSALSPGPHRLIVVVEQPAATQRRRYVNLDGADIRSVSPNVVRTRPCHVVPAFRQHVIVLQTCL